jgi:hypothetical protein
MVVTIRRWIKQAALHNHLRSDGLTVTNARNSIGCCGSTRACEKNVRLLVKAAAWFAQETGMTPLATFAFIRTNQAMHQIATPSSTRPWCSN